MKSNPVGWFEIYVEDMARAKAFYEAVFETKLEKLESPVPEVEMFAFPMDPERAGAPGALVKMEGFASGSNSTLVYFNSADCSIEVARIEPSGGRLERDKMSIGQYGYIALCYDTEGNMFGVHSQE